MVPLAKTCAGASFIPVLAILAATICAPPSYAAGRRAPSSGGGVDDRVRVDPAAFDRSEAAVRQDRIERAERLGWGKDRALRFRANELLIATDDPGMLRDVLASTGGQVVASWRPARHGFGSLSTRYRIRTDPERIGAVDIAGHLGRLHPASKGGYRVTSVAARQTVGAMLRIQAHGGQASLNVLLDPNDIASGVTADEPIDAGSVNVMGFPFIASGTTQDIGVDRAWQAIDLVHGLPFSVDDRVPVAVVDDGFVSPDLNDFPPVSGGHVLLDPPNDDLGLYGLHLHPDFAKHGAGVVASGFGVPDNGVGAAGPGGPVTALHPVRVDLDIFDLEQAVVLAAGAGARVIVITMTSFEPDEMDCVLFPMEDTFVAVRSQGTLIFANAGNNGLDIDDDDDGETWVFPCENDGVHCVGGLAHDSLSRAPGDTGSNFGAQHVDLFGPFTTAVADDVGDLDGDGVVGVRAANGTSHATPFVAGIATLVWAAAPGLTATEVEGILFGTAGTSPDPTVGLVVNARRAVLTALGTTSVVRITSPAGGSEQVHGAPLAVTAGVIDINDAPGTVTWTNDETGQTLGTGNTATLPTAGLPFGDITLRASVLSSAGVVESHAITINLNTPDLAPLSGLARLRTDGGVNIQLQVENQGPRDMNLPAFAPAVTYELLNSVGGVMHTFNAPLPAVASGASASLNANSMILPPHFPDCAGGVRATLNTGTSPYPELFTGDNTIIVPLDCPDLQVWGTQISGTIVGGIPSVTVAYSAANPTAVSASAYDSLIGVFNTAGSLVPPALVATGFHAGPASLAQSRTLTLPPVPTTTFAGKQVATVTVEIALDTDGGGDGQINEESEANNVHTEEVLLTDDIPPVAGFFLSGPATVNMSTSPSQIPISGALVVIDPDDPAAALTLGWDLPAGFSAPSPASGPLAAEGILPLSFSLARNSLLTVPCPVPGHTYTVTRTIGLTVSDPILSTSTTASVSIPVMTPATQANLDAHKVCMNMFNGGDQGAGHGAGVGQEDTGSWHEELHDNTELYEDPIDPSHGGGWDSTPYP